MQEFNLLENFFDSIQDEPCIGSTHICLYMGLLHYFVQNNFKNPITIKRGEIMKIAKIGGIATYHKCMKDLVSSGYILYQPSFHPGLGSLVDLRQI